jgi:hypothetical protein
MPDASNLVMSVAAIAAGLAIPSILTRFRPLFSARYGKITIPAVWVIAVALLAAAISIGNSHPGVATAFVVVPVPAALLATLVYRDQRREAAGLPAVETRFPQRLTIVGRSGVGFLAVVMGGIGALGLTVETSPDILATLGMLLVSVLLGYAAVTGHIPDVMRRVFFSK